MSRVLTLTLNPALDLSIRLAELSPGSVNRSEESSMTAAGKGNNVARVLARHSHQVAVSGFLGRDNQAPFERAFHEWGAEDRFIRVAGETRVNVKLSEADGRVTDINGSGAPVDEAAMTQLLDDIEAGADNLHAVVVSGSLPPGVAPEWLSALIGRLRTQGLPVWLDSSGKALVQGTRARPVLIKPNEHELAECVGRPLPDEAALLSAARELQLGGIENVLLSLGAEGVVWLFEGGTLRARPPRVEVVSTVCAGDTLLAGTLHGVLEGWSREKTLRFATALSADAVRRIGVGRSDVEDFTALCDAVCVEALTI
ncbi:1-phosphofructokinase [Kushneria phyllosphaerae]|uniref:Phosphofructokinase n=1 Tax=Kushneria phyllosphaerae TaxID=2100822 RepID=A0A2R8CM67_9GAMM|nr:1-phosphofructokinase [Kushneria phyllosphaerae]SPJ33864.1 Tagatose-6-phosphate kinase [Kushneria phyllosphaerae]